MALAAALGALWGCLGPSGARDAWEDVRGYLPDFLPGEYLAAVYDPQQSRAELVTRLEDVGALIPPNRPVVLVDLGAPVARALEAYDRYAERLLSKADAAKVTDLETRRNAG